MKASAFSFSAVFALGLVVGCGSEEPKDDKAIATEIAQGLALACPMSSTADEQARLNCAARLTEFDLFRDTLAEPLMWGGQKAGKGYRLSDSDTTRFNTLVWRRMYLSLFMFTGQFTIEQVADITAIRLPVVFRNELEIGSFPYPFWHSKNKWDSYQFSPEIILVMQNGKITGGLRSEKREPERKYVDHSWSGLWRWNKDGNDMPYVVLYKYLFSPKNPHIETLDQAYRALSEKMRDQACFVCHSPDNVAKVSVLEFFNLPNQALYSRHNIVEHLEMNTMPPKKNDLGFAKGIANEADRQELLTLARAFEAAGDDALKFDEELKPTVLAEIKPDEPTTP